MFLRSLFTFYVPCSEKKTAGKDAKAGKLVAVHAGDNSKTTLIKLWFIHLDPYE